MWRALKSRILEATRATGFTQRLSSSEWRRKRLLILCYHGFSQDDEHKWNPGLCMSPRTFEGRLAILQEGNYRVLSLTEAIDRLAKSSLPPKSVVLTFDDGVANFRSIALPLLRKYGYPATVYLRTDYCYYQRPVFHPVGPYLLWKRRDRIVSANPLLGWREEQDLRTQEGRASAWARMLRHAEGRQLDDEGRDCLLAQLAHHIGFDFDAFVASRILQIMSPAEVSAIAQEGIDVQLHTHRHRLIPSLDPGELREEIEENRKGIAELTGQYPVHLCYPSGKYNLAYLQPLRQLGIATATTCEPDLVCATSDPLLLPRYVDTEVQSQDAFEGWLSGVLGLLGTLRRRKYGYQQ